MLLLECTGSPIFTQRPGSSVIWWRNLLSMHLEAWQDGMNFASCAQSSWALPHVLLTALCWLWGPRNGPRSARQSVFGKYCRLTTCMATDKGFFGCFGTAIPQELWEVPFPHGKPFHPSTTEAQKTLQTNWAQSISFAIPWQRKLSAMKSLRSQASADSNKLCNFLSKQTL